MKNSRILSHCLVSTIILSSVQITANAQEPVECEIPKEVYEATANPVPEGIIYEYITDENGNFVLVDETDQLMEKSFPLNDAAPDLSDAFDPHSEPMPEGAFASPTVDTSGGNWFTRLINSIFSLFLA